MVSSITTSYLQNILSKFKETGTLDTGDFPSILASIENTDGSGELSESIKELQNFTTLTTNGTNCSDSDLANLSSIAALANIQTTDCPASQLTNLEKLIKNSILNPSPITSETFEEKLYNKYIENNSEIINKTPSQLGCDKTYKSNTAFIAASYQDISTTCDHLRMLSGISVTDDEKQIILNSAKAQDLAQYDNAYQKRSGASNSEEVSMLKTLVDKSLQQDNLDSSTRETLTKISDDLSPSNIETQTASQTEDPIKQLGYRSYNTVSIFADGNVDGICKTLWINNVVKIPESLEQTIMSNASPENIIQFKKNYNSLTKFNVYTESVTLKSFLDSIVNQKTLDADTTAKLTRISAILSSEISLRS